MDERQRRVVENEVAFRDFNEGLVGTQELIGQTKKSLRILCECGSSDCAKFTVVPRFDYEAARAEPTFFVVVPGHVVPDLERTVRREEAYWVVEKREGEPGALATEEDPRS